MKEETKKAIKDIIESLEKLPHREDSMKMGVQLPIEEWKAILRLDEDMKAYRTAFKEMSKNYFCEKNKLKYIGMVIEDILENGYE